MKPKVLIVGNGYIGNRICKELGFGISDRKITCLEDALSLTREEKPDILINCVGFIGRNVDDCEINKEKALFSNGFVPIMLAEGCLRNNIKFIHISSGCIYHYDYAHDSPITEEKDPDFLGLYYSRTKIYAENALRALFGKYPYLILRIRVPLDNRSTPKNLLDKLIGYKKVITSPNSVTYIPDFIHALKHLIEIKASGIFNIVNKSPLVFPDLMKQYQKYVPDFRFEEIDFAKLNMVRTNLILSAEKLERTGFAVRDIYDCLEECVQGYIASIKKP